MPRITETAVLLFALFAICASAPGSINNVNKVGVEVQVVSSIKEFKARNTFLKLNPMARTGDSVEETDSAENNGKTDKLTYSLGTRLDGDRLVAEGGSSNQYPTLQDVQATIQYPSPDADPDSAAIVNFVQIEVNQSSDLGNAYVVEGGIGERNIKIILEIQETLYFSFSVSVYGY